MKVAVLPLNAPEGTNPALGRQFSNLIAEVVRGTTGSDDVQSVSYLARVDEDGVSRAAHVNLGSAPGEHAMFRPLFEEAGAEKVIHGVITQDGDDFAVHLRVDVKESENPSLDEQHKFSKGQIFEELRKLSKTVADQTHLTLDDTKWRELNFGTKNPDALLKYMEGLDALQYIQHANGNVIKEFNPKAALDALLEAMSLDKEFPGPFNVAIQLCRVCAQYRLGTFEEAIDTLQKLSAAASGDFRPQAAIGEVYQTVGDLNSSLEAYENALAIHEKLGDELDESAKQERATLYSRLGAVQLNMGLPVNAERNLRKAAEMEAPEKPSLDLLTVVLQQTNRGHEVPALWKQEVERRPQDGPSRAKFATALFQAGRRDEAIAEFEKGLAELDDSTFVKLAYAPVLSQMGEVDRAMDFYEDCIDADPTNPTLQLQYAHTLKAADREFEIPAVLKNVLASNPEPNLRAQTLAWLVELEQPKRAEAVQAAREKIEKEDYDGAVRELKPLRNWLADYWKLWALLALAYNKMKMSEEAEDAGQRLMNLYPGYEPVYPELMNALLAMGRNEEAYNVMRFGMSNVPNSLVLTANLGVAAKKAGHEEEAQSIARMVRDVVNANPAAKAEFEPLLAQIDAK